MALVRTSDLMYENNVDPTASENFAAGFKVGDDFRNTATNKVFMCIGDGVWSNLSDSVTGEYISVDGPIEIKAGATLNPPTIVGSQNNYSPAGWIVTGEIQVSFLVLNASGNITLTGLEAPSPAKGMRITLFNDSATQNITLANNSGSSLAANRFLSNGNIALNEKEAIDLIYSTTESRWIPITR
jgi:hypothetical protein